MGLMLMIVTNKRNILIILYLKKILKATKRKSFESRTISIQKSIILLTMSILKITLYNIIHIIWYCLWASKFLRTWNISLLILIPQSRIKIFLAPLKQNLSSLLAMLDQARGGLNFSIYFPPSFLFHLN